MWVKNNNKWELIENVVDNRTVENNKITKVNGKTTVYIPTHNVNDVFEWWRIFKESYLYSTNTDRFGLGIQGYFNKDRGESNCFSFLPHSTAV